MVKVLIIVLVVLVVLFLLNKMRGTR